MTDTVRIVIEAKASSNEGEFTAIDAAAEILFNAGIGNPENGEPWPNMVGQAYTVTNFYATDTTDAMPWPIPEYSME
jgi:hypothetical protein